MQKSVLILYVQDSDLKTVQTACQLSEVEIIEEKKTDGLFGGGYELRIVSKTPIGLYNLGFKVSELK